MFKARKGDTISVGIATGVVLTSTETKMLVDLGEGFTCLLLRDRFRSK